MGRTRAPGWEEEITRYPGNLRQALEAVDSVEGLSADLEEDRLYSAAVDHEVVAGRAALGGDRRALQRCGARSA